jgi:Protein of unknown function (DUF3396)
MTTNHDHPGEANINVPVFRDEQGKIFLRIGLTVTLYFHHGASAETRMRVGECLDLFLALVGKNVHFMTNRSGTRWQRLEDQRVVEFKKALHFTLSPPESWEFSCQGGANAHEASEFQFSVFGDGAVDALSYLRVLLPMTWLRPPHGSFVDLVQQFCRILGPYHGYAGFGFIESSDIELEYYGEPMVYALSRRFPGIEVDRPLVHLMYLSDGIKGVNWLTILGPHWTQQMGGVSALRTALPGPFVFREFDGGVIIQAGPTPEMGDCNQQLWPKYYQQVAQLLKPIRTKRHGCFDHAGTHRFTDETTMEWLMRFDRDPW